MNNPSDHLPPKVAYHYGSSLRKHFMLAVVALFLIILDKEFFTFYLIVGVCGILLLTLFAALTSARHVSIIAIDIVISIVMFFIFEYFAIRQYTQVDTFFDKIFLLRQFLAIIFLGALYNSIRTLRSDPQDTRFEKLSKEDQLR